MFMILREQMILNTGKNDVEALTLMIKSGDNLVMRGPLTNIVGLRYSKVWTGFTMLWGKYLFGECSFWSLEGSGIFSVLIIQNFRL